MLLFGSGWLFLGVLQDVVANDPLVQVDQSIYYLLQGIRTRWVDVVMVTITELGGPTVLMAVILIVAVLLASMRRWRTFAYWLAAVGFAEILVQLLKFTLGHQRPPALASDNTLFSFPSGHATLSIVVYGFLAFLLTREQSQKLKRAVMLVAVVIVASISFSRLYLGAHWFSDVLAGLSLGLGWVALLGIAYTHHVRNETLPVPQLSLAVLATLVGVGGGYVSSHQQADLVRYAYRPKFETISLDAWQQQGWRNFPVARSELGGEAEEPFSVQWVASPSQISATLAAAGWRKPTPWSMKTAFLWIVPGTPIEQLPVLPKFNEGAPQQLNFIQPRNAHTRWVLRLWPLHYRVTHPGYPTQPLWIGMITQEQLRTVKGGLTLAQTSTDFVTPVQAFSNTLRVPHVIARRQQGDASVLLIW